MQLDTHILEFLLEKTEISPKIVKLFIPCETKEGCSGQVVSYVHHPEGIFYAWHTFGNKEYLLFYFFGRNYGDYFDRVIGEKFLNGQKSHEYINCHIKEWLQEAMHNYALLTNNVSYKITDWMWGR
jgi:hypothetical protein